MIADKNTLQIEYGTVATSYVAYDPTLKLPKENAPVGLVFREDLPAEITSYVGSVPKIVLPNNLFMMSSAENILWIDSFVRKPTRKADVSINIDNLNMYSAYPEALYSNKSESTVTNTIKLYNHNSLLQTKTVITKAVKAPTILKTVNVWSTGDSITDLGTWQPLLKTALQGDNITANFVGSQPITTGIRGEAFSGGNLGLIAEASTAAIILDVSGITTAPVTGYPGAQYKDSNNNVWVVRSVLLSGSAGALSGKIKFGIFQADPNYADQTGGTSPTGAFPASGTMTKVNGLAGDATITYTAKTDTNYNPFWNPATNQIDFLYHQSNWSLPTPDVFILQYGYNEVKHYLTAFKDEDNLYATLAVQRLKAVVTKFHEQFPLAKIIYGIEPYGCNYPTYAGGYETYNSQRYSDLSLAQAIINEFDTPTYNSYMYVCPVYAFFNHDFGYGPIIEKQLSTVYPNYKVKTLENGYDGIHPSNTLYGAIEEARAYRPIINLIAGL
jgi:hypothetical protein